MARVMQELTIEEAAARSGYSRPYLAQLLAEGKLRGRKIAKVWVLDSASLDAYQSVPHKPGPKGPIKKRELEVQKEAHNGA